MSTAQTAVVVMTLACAQTTGAAVTVFHNPSNQDAARQEWMQSAAPFTTIDFTGFPANTIITNQYQDQGILFTDGTDRITYNANAFPNDGVGLRGVLDEIHVSFLQPTYSIAVDFPGSVKFRLYWQGILMYTSSDFFDTFGPNGFAGLISDTPFDAAVILDPAGNVNIDDLFFGPPIPAPPAFALLAFAAIGYGMRRRS